MVDLDLHLHDHAGELYRAIRQRALVQYTAPFTSVRLATMAEAFSCSVPELEKELAALIADNQVQVRGGGEGGRDCQGDCGGVQWG